MMAYSGMAFLAFFLFLPFSLDCIYHTQGRSYYGLWHKTMGMMFHLVGGVQDGYREAREAEWYSEVRIT